MSTFDKQNVLNALAQIELLIRDVREVIQEGELIVRGPRPDPGLIWNCDPDSETTTK